MKFNKMIPQVMICYLKMTPQNQFQNFENNSPAKWLPNPPPSPTILQAINDKPLSILL